MQESNNKALSEKVPLNEPASVRSARRRRLLTGGMGTAPFLLTLVSRPVLGQVCTTPSGFVSMPTSVHGTPQTCLGRTPGYWKQTQSFSDWMLPYFPTKVSGPGGHAATLFTQVFNPTPYASSATFLDVLNMQAGPPNDVARHVVATILNIARGWIPVLTVPQVQGIWQQYMNTGGGTAGYFEPTAGVKWFHDDIVAYLVSTMPA
jgi:hypothetical protein